MSIKLVSWNVNGIRACLKRKCFDPMMSEVKPDIFCIQETKAHPDQVDNIFSGFEHHYWNAAEKAGYAGTAIFSKIKPLNVTYGIDIKEHDTEGRVITLEFRDYFFVNVYVPNSGRGLPRLQYRKKWDVDFLFYIKQLEKKKLVVVAGDLNVAHTTIDLANSKENYNKTAGYTQVEIDGFKKLLRAGFMDTFREFNKEPGQYSYWGKWNNLRARNIGWRIDYFLISRELRSRVKDAFILPKIMGSDHCPVGIVLNEKE